MRQAGSHKGDNGTVAIIGGSRHQHGAPLFSLLAAQASGVDLLFACVPLMHLEVTKATSLNAQVYTFGSALSDEITASDTTRFVELLATIDVAVIGPGISRSPSSLRSVMELLQTAPCTVVADATALQAETLAFLAHRHAVITPHLGELERMGLTRQELPKVAQGIDLTILLKSTADTVISETGKIQEVIGGNAGLTVGGTGDALAGLVAGLIAQGMDHDEACVRASTVIKKAGDLLMAEVGYAYTTRDVIAKIPALLKEGNL